MHRAPLTLALLAATMVAVSPSAAAGQGPPAGKYECVIGSASYLFGTITIGAKSSYAKDGTKGTYTAGAFGRLSDGKHGATLRFKGGSLNGYKGRWYRATGAGSTAEIALKNPLDGFESIYCDN